MTTDNQYDTAEAESIFAFAQARSSERFAVEKGEAITALQRQLEDLAKKRGAQAEIDPRGILFIRDRSRTVQVEEQEGGVSVIQLDRFGKAVGDWTAAPLDFDLLQKLYVGREEDTYYVPEPGQPRKRRSALAVVAEMVVGMLYGAEKT